MHEITKYFMFTENQDIPPLQGRCGSMKVPPAPPDSKIEKNHGRCAEEIMDGRALTSTEYSSYHQQQRAGLLRHQQRGAEASQAAGAQAAAEDGGAPARTQPHTNGAL